MGAPKLNAAEKAAVVLLSLGQELASDIMSQMTPEEVRRVASAMSRLGRVDEQVVREVAGEFHTALVEQKPTVLGDARVAQRLLERAGQGEAARALDGAMDLASPMLTETLLGIDAKVLANYLSREHPQTIAVVLAHCGAKQAGDTLRLLPEELRVISMQRLAHLGSIDPESLEAITSSLRSETERLGSRQGRALGGVDKLVALVNGVGSQRGDAMLRELEERDPELAAKVKAKLFTFEHLLRIGDRGMQMLLAQVPGAALRLALKGASEAVSAHIYKNLSARAAQLLKDDVLALPKTRLSEVEAAQRQIAVLAQALAAAGKIEIPDPDVAYV